MNKLIAVFILIFSSYQFFSQQSNHLLDSERPNQTESVTISPLWTPQLEMGYVYENTINETYYKEHNISHPVLLLRLGIIKNTEFRFSAEFGTHFTKIKHNLSGSIEESDKTGFKPIKLGVKTRFFEGKKLIPSAAILINIVLPKSASKYFIEKYVVPEFTLALSHDISKKLSIGYNIGMNRDSENNEWSQSFSISANFSFTKRLLFFIEGYGFYKNKVDADNRFDAGVMYIPTKDLQLDISGGIGLSEFSPNTFIGAGISFRLPKI